MLVKSPLILLLDCSYSPCSRTLQIYKLNTGSAELAAFLNQLARCAPNHEGKPGISIPRCESLQSGEIYQACVCMHVGVCT